MKYNKTKTQPMTAVTTHQGGQGFEFKPELALMSLLASGISNTFYEKEGEQENRLAELIDKVATKNPLLVAQMLVYTRETIGQRSVTHRGAVALAKLIGGTSWAKDFFSKRSRNENYGGIVYRLDDMLEIAACYSALNPGKRLPNAMTKGFKLALEKADAYELAKYKGEGKEITLVDLVNLVHPKPSKDMKKVFNQLMKGELKQFNTVEDKNTKAGQVVAAKVKAGELTEDEGKVVLAKEKTKNFTSLTKDGDIGYLALLKNLRNILKVSPSQVLIEQTVKQLTDQDAITKSLVFPHQIDLALEVLMEEFSNSVNRDIVLGLSRAYELAIPNLTELAVGRTAVVLDESGSMTERGLTVGNNRTTRGAIEKGALIAATLAKGLNADVYSFDNRARERSYNPNDSVATIRQGLMQAQGGGTSFGTIFPVLKHAYDRVFIISDMQGSDMIGTTLSDYKKKFGVDPYVYCVNLNGYNTTMFKPNSKVFQIFGYSAEIYEIIKRVEVNYNVMLDEVKKINLGQKVLAEKTAKKKVKKVARKAKV